MHSVFRRSIFILFGVVPLLIAGLATQEAAAQVCVGDCNGNRVVAINELVTGVNIALNSQSVDVCPAVDRNNSRTVSVDELVVAVNNALRGCPMVTPTTISTLTMSATATNTVPISSPTTSHTVTASPTPTNTVPTATATLTATATPTPQPPTIHAEINPDRVAPGESVIVSITVTNPGLTDLTGVIVRASLPAAGIGTVDRFFISDNGSCNNASCVAGQQAAWNIGTLAHGTGRTVSFPMTVLPGQTAPADETALTTMASIVADGIGQISTDATAIVDRNRALAVSIDEDHDPVAPSAELRYAVRYGNRGLTALTAATLDVPLPAGTNFISATDGGTLANGTVTWPLGDLAAGANGVREMIVEVDSNAGEAIAAQAMLASGIEEAVAQTVARVQPAPDLTVSLVAGPEPVAPGEPLAVSLTITNRGATDLFGVTAELRVPPEVLPFAPADADGSGVHPRCVVLLRQPGARDLTIGNLAAGHGVTLNIPPVVLSGQTAPRSGTLISIDVEVVATDAPQLKLRRNVIVETNRKLELELDPSPQPVAHGALLTYSLSFGNRSVGQLAPAQLTMPLPVGTAFLSASDGGTAANGVVTWPLGDLAAGASGVRELVVIVDDMADEGQPVVAEATLVAGDAEARAQVATRVQTETDLIMEIDVGPDPIMPGEPLQGSVTVSNRGPVTLFEVQAEVRVPPELAAFGPDHANFLVSCRTGVSFACDPLERALWTVGDLAPGQGATLTFPATVLSGQTGPPGGTVIVFDASANDGRSRRRVAASRCVRTARSSSSSRSARRRLASAKSCTTPHVRQSQRRQGGASLELPIPPGTRCCRPMAEPSRATRCLAGGGDPPWAGRIQEAGDAGGAGQPAGPPAACARTLRRAPTRRAPRRWRVSRMGCR
jgi:hypothetical protein